MMSLPKLINMKINQGQNTVSVKYTSIIIMLLIFNIILQVPSVYLPVCSRRLKKTQNDDTDGNWQGCTMFRHPDDSALELKYDLLLFEKVPSHRCAEKVQRLLNNFKHQKNSIMPYVFLTHMGISIHVLTSARGELR